MLDSRGSAETIRRRRECMECARRFTTYERVAPPEIRVQKRGEGGTQPFERDKLLRVVQRVVRGRDVSARACADLVRGLEAQLVDEGAATVASSLLADRLLAKLRELDPLAAQRFASNYLQEDGSIRTADDGPSPQLQFQVVTSITPAQPPAEDDAPEPRRRRRRAP